MMKERMKEWLELRDSQIEEFEVTDKAIEAKIRSDGIDLQTMWEGLTQAFSTTNIEVWPELYTEKIPYSEPDTYPVLVIYAQKD
jgi:hypothetical protein